MLAGALNPASACTYGVVKERKVAITGLPIRIRCRFFCIAGLFECFPYVLCGSCLRSLRLKSLDRKPSATDAKKRQPTRNLTENPFQSHAIIGWLRPWQQSVEGELNHPK